MILSESRRLHSPHTPSQSALLSPVSKTFTSLRSTSPLSFLISPRLISPRSQTNTEKNQSRNQREKRISAHGTANFLNPNAHTTPKTTACSASPPPSNFTSHISNTSVVPSSPITAQSPDGDAEGCDGDVDGSGDTGDDIASFPPSFYVISSLSTTPRRAGVCPRGLYFGNRLKGVTRGLYLISELPFRFRVSGTQAPINVRLGSLPGSEEHTQNEENIPPTFHQTKTPIECENLHLTQLTHHTKQKIIHTKQTIPQCEITQKLKYPKGAKTHTTLSLPKIGASQLQTPTSPLTLFISPPSQGVGSPSSPRVTPSAVTWGCENTEVSAMASPELQGDFSSPNLSPNVVKRTESFSDEVRENCDSSNFTTTHTILISKTYDISHSHSHDGTMAPTQLSLALKTADGGGDSVAFSVNRNTNVTPTRMMRFGSEPLPYSRPKGMSFLFSFSLSFLFLSFFYFSPTNTTYIIAHHSSNTKLPPTHRTSKLSFHSLW
jgi:hypothetical protein